MLKIERADTFIKRLLGLIGRKGLEPEHALLLAPCKAIHMLGMGFAIDAVFVDKALCVKKIVRELKPWFGFAVCFEAWAVLELRAGETVRLNLEVGQFLEVEWT